jgi:hypothetical protein
MIEWLRTHPDGLRDEFKTYFSTLTNDKLKVRGRAPMFDWAFDITVVPHSITHLLLRPSYVLIIL